MEESKQQNHIKGGRLAKQGNTGPRYTIKILTQYIVNQLNESCKISVTNVRCKQDVIYVYHYTFVLTRTNHVTFLFSCNVPTFLHSKKIKFQNKQIYIAMCVIFSLNCKIGGCIPDCGCVSNAHRNCI